jgi:hypothetical protein
MSRTAMRYSAVLNLDNNTYRSAYICNCSGFNLENHWHAQQGLTVPMYDVPECGQAQSRAAAGVQITQVSYLINSMQQQVAAECTCTSH